MTQVSAAVPDATSVDLRDVTAALLGAVLREQSLDLAAARFEIAFENKTECPARRTTLMFDGVSSYKASTGGSAAGEIEVQVIGLERLGPGEPWRLYIRTPSGVELELTCSSIHSGGRPVTGVGRSYRT